MQSQAGKRKERKVKLSLWNGARQKGLCHAVTGRRQELTTESTVCDQTPPSTWEDEQAIKSSANRTPVPSLHRCERMVLWCRSESRELAVSWRGWRCPRISLDRGHYSPA